MNAPVTWRAILTDSLTWFGLGALGTNLPVPATPVPDVIAGLWIGMRRLHYSLFNTAPTLNPTQPVLDPVTGTVTGSLGGFDADGDVITYSLVSPPGEGTVDIAPDGTWTYVATAACGCTVDTDSFTVSATDTGPQNPWHVNLLGGRVRQDDMLSATGGSTATITVTDVPGTCAAAGPDCGALGSVPSWAQNLSKTPASSPGDAWYDTFFLFPDGKKGLYSVNRPASRASSDAVMEYGNSDYLSDDGIKGMIKNYSNQVVMVEMRNPSSMSGYAGYAWTYRQAILLPGDEMPYTIGSDGNAEHQVLYFYLMDDSGKPSFGPVRLRLDDPYWSWQDPETAFAPANRDFGTPRTGWQPGTSHHEIWGGTDIWVKRENDGWTVPYSEAWYKTKQAVFGGTNKDQLMNSRPMKDWAVFTIHINGL